MTDFTEDQIIECLPPVALDRCFLVGEVGYQGVGFWEPQWGVMAHIIEDDDLSAAAKDYLRKRGNLAFGSIAEARHYAIGAKWEGWQKIQS